MIISRLKSKLKETKGVDASIEMGVILIVIIIVLIAIVGFSHLIYTNYKVMQFANESIRLVELYGEVSDETEDKIELLKKSIGIDPTVKFDKTGKIDFLENVNVTVELHYKLRIPFLDIKIKIVKSATGTGEVYWK